MNYGGFSIRRFVGILLCFQRCHVELEYHSQRVADSAN
jgi:hypothetical protein